MGPLTTFNPKAAIPEPVRRNRGGSFNFENAVQLDGVNDQVDATGFIGQPITDFAFSFWFNTSSTAGNRGLFGLNGAATSNNVRLRISAGFLTLRIWDTFGTTIIDSPSIIGLTANTWYHMVVVGNFTSKIVTLYLDSSSIIAVSVPNWFSNYGTITFSQSGGGASSTYLGKIDEATFWERTINQVEINRYYNLGIGSDSYDLTSIGAWWRLNETGSPATSADSSGNGNDLTLTNGPTFVAH